jgi:tRNA modification GTPase
MSPAATTTIVAISSPPGAGLRGVVRLSGPRARELVRSTWAGAAPPDLDRRGVSIGRFHDGRGEQPLLLLWMPAPRSFTREDVAEMHLPGSPPLLDAALRRLISLGAVPASPGEFTRRAFASGRIDLTRAEGVLALVAARSESERRASTALLLGGLAERIARAREGLEELRALCEASLDFEETDTGHVPAAELEQRRAQIAGDLARTAHFEDARVTARSGLPRVVLFGAQNAGKSSLFNALIGEQRALVSDVAGTTRDALTADIRLAGVAVRLCDTAGLDAAATGPDRIAQAVASGARDSADIALWVVDAAAADAESLRVRRTVRPSGVECVVAWNKIDLLDAAAVPPEALVSESSARAWVATSARTGAGLDELRSAIARCLAGDAEGAPGESAGLARELAARHAAGLARSAEELGLGFERWRAGAPLELLAEHLRRATSALDDISGSTTPEAILDRLFARFCIGK